MSLNNETFIGKGNSGDAQVPHSLNTAVGIFRQRLKRGEVDATKFLKAAKKHGALKNDFANEARFFKLFGRLAGGFPDS